MYGVERARPSHRLLYLLFALGLFEVAGLFFFETYRYYQISREVARLEQENEALWAKVRDLRAELAHANDPGELEALARRLGLVKKDEVLYVRKSH